MREEENEVLTTKEACEYLRISKPTFLDLIRRNQIKAKKVGRAWRVLKSELQGFLGVDQLENEHAQTEHPRRDRDVLNAIDRSILGVLSRYEYLTPLQLWYELGEDHATKQRVTEEEIQSRLETLEARGFVEKMAKREGDGDSASSVYHFRLRDDSEWRGSLTRDWIVSGRRG